MALYHVPVLEKFEWQIAVLDKDLTAPPSNPNKGDRYLIFGTPNGGWAGKKDNITYYDGSSWKFIEPLPGMIVYVIDEQKHYIYKDTWQEFQAGGDMFKAIYDQDDDGIVDFAEAIKSGSITILATAIQNAVERAHQQNTDTALGVLSQDINMGGNRVRNLGQPSQTGDAIRQTSVITEANLESTIRAKPVYVSEYRALEIEI